MAAPPPLPPPQEDPVLTSFRSYVVQRPGATHVTEKAVKAAFEAEIAKPFGKELLQAQIQAHATRRDNSYRIWEAEPNDFSGQWRSDATSFFVEYLYNNTTIKKTVTAKFPGGHFAVHGTTAIQGTMYINDDAFDQLNTTYLALVSTEEGEFDKNKHRLRIDWLKGPQKDVLVASFLSDDFPFAIAPYDRDEASKWSDYPPPK